MNDAIKRLKKLHAKIFAETWHNPSAKAQVLTGISMSIAALEYEDKSDNTKD